MRCLNNIPFTVLNLQLLKSTCDFTYRQLMLTFYLRVLCGSQPASISLHNIKKLALITEVEII